MKGDFTRFSFDPSKHYSGVRMQQGRVQLDCDWNEQIETQTRQQQLLTADLVGLTGAPQIGGGFHVAVSTDGKQLLLSPGRMYVGGLLCELNVATSYDQQTDYPGAPYPAVSDLNPTILGAPPPAGVAVPGKDANGNYVYLAYLDAWPRHVTALEDPSIAEIALGGPDTGTRVQTLAQVKLAPLSSDGTAGTPPILVPVADWNTITAASQAQLAAAAFVPDSPGSLSLAPGYVALPSFLQPPPAGSPAPSVPPVDFTLGFALEAWVYLPGSALAASVPILYLSDGTVTDANTIAIAIASSAPGAVLKLTVGSASCTAPIALGSAGWTHIAVSVAPAASTSTSAASLSDVTMYENGNPLSVRGTVPVPPNANRTSCFLGSTSATTTASFSGMLAEVRVWATGLAAPTVSSRITGNEANLVAYYKLNETGATTQTVNDSSPAQRTGVANGTFAWSANGPALTAAGFLPAQYSGPENQLYRVEIHSVSSGGVVTFKWSRDNGSIAASATLSTSTGGASPTQTLTLSTPVRDDVLGWALGQWVEITTATGDLQGVTGTLAQITGVQGNTLSIDAVASPSAGPVTVRRWDWSSSLPPSFTLPSAQPSSPWQSPWLALENGIAVQFGGQAVAPGDYWLPFKPGDYWLMPARTATRAIEWPLLANTQPAVLSPLGVRHQYAQLAKVYLTSAGIWKASTLPELRQTFPPIENALFSTGVLTYDATSVLVGGTFNVGTDTSPETANLFGPLNVTGALNAEGGINVTGAPLSIGASTALQSLRMNLGTIWFREGTDEGHGVVYAGGVGGTAFAPSAATNPDGPVLFGFGGGGLATINGGNKYALTWNNNQSVTVNGALNAEDGLNVTGAPLSIGPILGTPATALQSLRMNLGTIWFREGTDPNHGLVYAGGAGGTAFAPSPATNPDGPVLFGYGGGGLGTTNGGNKYALTWDNSQNVTVNGVLNVTGALNAEDGINVTGAPLSIGASTALQSLRMNLGTIWLRAGTDEGHGLVYAGGAGGTAFAPSPASNPDGPVLFGYGGGGLATINGGNKYALTWDNNQNVTVNGALDVTGPATLSGWPQLSPNHSIVVHCLEIMATSSVTTPVTTIGTGGIGTATINVTQPLATQTLTTNPNTVVNTVVNTGVTTGTAPVGLPCVLLNAGNPLIVGLGAWTWIRLSGLPNTGLVTSVNVVTYANVPASFSPVILQLVSYNPATSAPANELSSPVTVQATFTPGSGGVSITTSIPPTGGGFLVDPANIYVLLVTHPFTAANLGTPSQGAKTGVLWEINDVAVSVNVPSIASG
jgi:hypothetical protein